VPRASSSGLGTSPDGHVGRAIRFNAGFQRGGSDPLPPRASRQKALPHHLGRHLRDDLLCFLGRHEQGSRFSA